MSPKAKNYPQLHKLDWTPNWVFRKYSKEKRKEFVHSTGLEATEKNAPAAYKAGVAAFDRWLGVYLPSGRELLMKDLARAVLASKESKKGGKSGATYRDAYNQITNHVIPAFGHLRADQVTPLKWQQYDALERKKGKRTKLANTRKFLREILHRALDEGYIQRVPKLKNNDGEAAPPKYVPARHMRAILRHPSCRFTKHAYFIMWKMGGRPSEVLQYEWAMIDWTDGAHGSIAIPGRITKTGRSRTIELNSRVSRVLKGRLAKAKADAAPDAEIRFIFPSRYKADAPQTNYRKGWEAACLELGFDYTPYNARDTFITDKLNAGVSSALVGKYVDNSSQMIDQKYAVLIKSAMRRIAG